MCKRCNQKKIEKKCCDDHREKRCCKPNRMKFVTKCCGSKYERCNLGCKKSNKSNIPQNYCFEKMEGITILKDSIPPVFGPTICFFIERFGKRVTINIPSIYANYDTFFVKFEFIDPKYRPKEVLTFICPSIIPENVFLIVKPNGEIIWKPDPEESMFITTLATAVTYLVC